MIGPTAAELAEQLEAEQLGIEAGWLAPCDHESLLHLPCVRSAGHRPPHALRFPDGPDETSAILPDRPR